MFAGSSYPIILERTRAGNENGTGSSLRAVDRKRERAVASGARRYAEWIIFRARPRRQGALSVGGDTQSKNVRMIMTSERPTCAEVQRKNPGVPLRPPRSRVATPKTVGARPCQPFSAHPALAAATSWKKAGTCTGLPDTKPASTEGETEPPISLHAASVGIHKAGIGGAAARAAE